MTQQQPVSITDPSAADQLVQQAQAQIRQAQLAEAARIVGTQNKPQ